ncbi:2-dehydropantoate 2-reductase [Rossellomorea aquimaris]|uniref:2-dehydropantoate 2-reductase n=1 Tax=Rossellomorea aquimaris TaxID=189382 RepID=UPI0007D0A86F|nr:2-dehydropantoate 2-reductase [Rossellomorea aquimaris]
MNIGVIGGGAIGLLLSGYLGRNLDVTLIVRRLEQREEIEHKGITIHTSESSISTSVNVRQLTGHSLDVDLLVIAVKEYDLASLKEWIETLHPSQPLLFLQNGIGHLDWVKDLPHHTLLVGSIEHGAFKVSDHTVEHRGKGKINVSIIRGDYKILEELLSNSTETFPFYYCDDYEEMLLKKLFINVLINPLTAITRVPNGELVNNTYFHDIQLSLYKEMLILFPNMKDIISLEEIQEICITTFHNRSSMLKDIESSKVTEIETIVGVLLQKATEENHFLPTMNVLYMLVKGIEFEAQGG